MQYYGGLQSRKFGQIEISGKLAKKVDFRKILDPNLGFSTKQGFKIRDLEFC